MSSTRSSTTSSISIILTSTSSGSDGSANAPPQSPTAGSGASFALAALAAPPYCWCTLPAPLLILRLAAPRLAWLLVGAASASTSYGSCRSAAACSPCPERAYFSAASTAGSYCQSAFFSRSNIFSPRTGAALNFGSCIPPLRIFSAAPLPSRWRVAIARRRRRRQTAWLPGSR